jgi:hypothetical protein
MPLHMHVHFFIFWMNVCMPCLNFSCCWLVLLSIFTPLFMAIILLTSSRYCWVIHCLILNTIITSECWFVEGHGFLGWFLCCGWLGIQDRSPALHINAWDYRALSLWSESWCCRICASLAWWPRVKNFYAIQSCTCLTFNLKQVISIHIPSFFNSLFTLISILQFVDEACHQIERNERNVRQTGVLSYIPR